MRHQPHSQQLRDLADRLVVEYAGAVTPGQIETAVRRADLGLDDPGYLSGADRALVCESLVRRELTDQLASYCTTRPAESPNLSATHLLAS